MKKILLILTVVVTASFTSIDNNEIVEAQVTYSGQSDKAYYFANKDTGKVLEFTFVSKKAISKYDLSTKKLTGKEFMITYEIDNIEIVSKDTQVKQYKKRLILIDIKIIESEVVNN